MLAMDGEMMGNVQWALQVAIMAIEHWLSLLLSSGIIKKFGFAASSFSGVCLVMGVKAKLNPEVSCFDNGLDGSLVPYQVNNAVAAHGSQGSGKVAFFSPRNFCQFSQGVWFLFEDDFQQLLVVLVQDLSHRVQRFKPYLRFMLAGTVVSFGDRDGSLLVFLLGDDSDCDNVFFHFFTWL